MNKSDNKSELKESKLDNHENEIKQGNIDDIKSMKEQNSFADNSNNEINKKKEEKKI